MENKMPPLTLGRLDKHYLVVRSVGRTKLLWREWGVYNFQYASLLLLLVLVIILIP